MKELQHELTTDEPLGCVNWHRQSVGAVAYYWAMGIAMLPEVRGHGYGTDARLLARYLFAHTTAHRLDNHQVKDALRDRRSADPGPPGAPAPWPWRPCTHHQTRAGTL
jgi:hypothetical protein